MPALKSNHGIALKPRRRGESAVMPEIPSQSKPDEARFEAWLQGPELTTWLQNYFRPRLKDASARKDLESECRLRLLNKWRQGAGIQLMTEWYAIGIARNVMREWYRQATRWVIAEDADAVAANSTENPLQDALEHCLGKLQPSGRDLLAKRFNENWDVPRIARESAHSGSTVYRRLEIAYAFLRRCIEEQIGPLGGNTNVS